MTVATRSILTFHQPSRSRARRRRTGPNMAARLLATLRLWRQRMRDRQALSQLSERELRDMRASSADVYWEVSQPFWRDARRR